MIVVLPLAPAGVGPTGRHARGRQGTLFLLALVTCASLMPVEKLPPRPGRRLGLGFVSAVFDNIPLTSSR